MCYVTKKFSQEKYIGYKDMLKHKKFYDSNIFI